MTLPGLAAPRPQIIVGPDDVEMVERASRELIARRPDLYRIGEPGSGSCVVLTDAGTRSLRTEQVAALLSHEINWRAADKPTKPPPLVAELFAMGDCHLRPLAGISALPLLRPDGSVHAVPGWDEATGLLVRDGAERLAGRVGSTALEAKLAAARLLSAVHGAPWSGETDPWSWLAHALTVAGRHLVDGPVPAWIYNATEADSGKTTLAKFASWIVTGREPTTQACEFEATALGRYLGPAADDAAVIIDNVRGVTLRSDFLEALLTDGQIRYDRKYENAVLRPFRAVLAITMNSAAAGKDIARRSVAVSLSKRRGEAMPAYNLLVARAGEREQLACDLLTILRAWIVTGRPHGGVLSSFAAWSHVIGGAMALLGKADWIAQTKQAAAALDSDDEGTTEIVRLFREWLTAAKLTAATSAQVLASSLADDLCKAVAASWNKPRALLDAKAIGMVLARSTGWTAYGRLLRTKVEGTVRWSVDVG